MMVNSFTQSTFAASVRSCCRCGVEFHPSDGGTRVCKTCRCPRRPPRLRVVPGQELSQRERQVAALVAQGLPNKLIASALHLSEGTIKVYLFHIFQKTKVANRTELAVWHVRNSSPGEPRQDANGDA